MGAEPTDLVEYLETGTELPKGRAGKVSQASWLAKTPREACVLGE